MSLSTTLIAIVLGAILISVARSKAGFAVISLRELLRAISRDVSILLASVTTVIGTVSKEVFW